LNPTHVREKQGTKQEKKEVSRRARRGRGGLFCEINPEKGGFTQSAQRRQRIVRSNIREIQSLQVQYFLGDLWGLCGESFLPQSTQRTQRSQNQNIKTNRVRRLRPGEIGYAFHRASRLTQILKGKSQAGAYRKQELAPTKRIGRGRRRKTWLTSLTQSLRQTPFESLPSTNLRVYDRVFQDRLSHEERGVEGSRDNLY
jgi:hypothetical protein